MRVKGIETKQVELDISTEELLRVVMAITKENNPVLTQFGKSKW